jgi:hypothetical protein
MVNTLNSNRIFNNFSTNIDSFIHLNTFLKKIPLPTNKEESILLNFRFKLLTNSLPIKTNLHIKYLLLYTNNLCPSCKNQPENLDHILNCPSYSQIFSKLISLTHNTISNLQNEKIDSKKLTNHLSNPTNILYFAIGTEPTINFLQKSNLVPTELQGPIQNDILQHFYKTIWFQRNDNMIIEERLLNITKKTKKNLKLYQNKQQFSPPTTNPFSSPNIILNTSLKLSLSNPPLSLHNKIKFVISESSSSTMRQ